MSNRLAPNKYYEGSLSEFIMEQKFTEENLQNMWIHRSHGGRKKVTHNPLTHLGELIMCYAISCGTHSSNGRSTNVFTVETNYQLVHILIHEKSTIDTKVDIVKVSLINLK